MQMLMAYWESVDKARKALIPGNHNELEERIAGNVRRRLKSN
jgi:hypothetical protein